MSDIKPIKVFGIHGPNAGKVILLCKELGLPYETELIPISDAKNPQLRRHQPQWAAPGYSGPQHRPYSLGVGRYHRVPKRDVRQGPQAQLRRWYP